MMRLKEKSKIAVRQTSFDRNIYKVIKDRDGELPLYLTSNTLVDILNRANLTNENVLVLDSRDVVVLKNFDIVG